MSVALQIITDALQEIGVIDGSEPLDPNDSNKALRKMNALLESWSIQNLAVFVQSNLSFSLIPGKAVYTIGPLDPAALVPPDVITTRITGVDGAFCSYQSIDFGVEVIDNQQYNDIAYKAQVGPIIQYLSFDAFSPLSQVTLWPVPNYASGLTLLTNQLFSTPVTLTTEMNFPPGYDRAFTLALAVELCPSFGKEAGGTLVQLAQQAVKVIKRQNSRTPVLQYDPAIPTGTRGWGDGSIAYGGGGAAPAPAPTSP